jgi:molecular chaperone GrpE
MTSPFSHSQPAEDNAETTAEQAAGGTAQDNPLEARLETLEQENAKLRDQLMRAVAETDNVRKRAQRDVDEASRYAVSNFARDMVSVLENLIRASESVPESARASNDLLKTIAEGVDLTLQELLSTFKRYGIERIDPINQKFDHNLHQAAAQVERADVPAGTVIQVVQAGYVMHDRLLRPAMVAVSKQVEPPKHVDTTA